MRRVAGPHAPSRQCHCGDDAGKGEKFQPAKDVRPPQAELLERFTIVRLKSDPGEQQRIAEQISDLRTREGVQRYGLAEYVGAGHLAVHRFETGESEHPLGAAMVRAAADWHRVGLDAIPATSLAALAPRYLPQPYRHDPGEDTKTATEWAKERVEGIYRLLEPTDGGYRAFDYIVDYLSRAADPVPEFTWREAAASAPVDRANFLAHRAYFVGHTDVAGQLWQSLVDSGHDDAPAAVSNLGVVRKEQGGPGGCGQGVPGGDRLRPCRSGSGGGGQLGGGALGPTPVCRVSESPL
jgi:transcriptional regulator with XRE-family HTH domain